VKTSKAAQKVRREAFKNTQFFECAGCLSQGEITHGHYQTRTLQRRDCEDIALLMEVEYEYECTCGHVGWSNHPGVLSLTWGDDNFGLYGELDNDFQCDTPALAAVAHIEAVFKNRIRHNAWAGVAKLFKQLDTKHFTDSWYSIEVVLAPLLVTQHIKSHPLIRQARESYLERLLTDIDMHLRALGGVRMTLDDAQDFDAWSLDPAASGPRRRFWADDVKLELRAYAVGNWYVYPMGDVSAAARASGRAPTLALAQEQCLKAARLVAELMKIEGEG